MTRVTLPTMDVAETDKEIEITAELPGLEEKDVQINVSDNILTIRGEKKAETEQEDKNYRLIERSYGAFERSLELPEGVDADAIDATIDKGVLKVVVPKPAPAQAKKIEVKSAA
jgi:HSP20 family protein